MSAHPASGTDSLAIGNLAGRPWAQHLILWAVCVFAVLALHIPYLDLPYYWDEAGYYFPAALELANHGRLIPQTTAANPHPPLLSAYLSLFIKVFGPAPLAIRTAMALLAGTAVYGVLLLAAFLMPATSGLWAAGLFALSPLFFAQSTMVHLDVAATAATLLTVYFFLRGRLVPYLIAGAALCLIRETGVVPILILTAFGRRPVLAAPLLPLAAWFVFLRIGTGHWLGDPGFVAYNVWEALNPARFLVTLLRRLHFLAWVDFRWVLALPALWLLNKRIRAAGPRLPSAAILLSWILAGQILVMSLFGGAILNRYLLPALALFYLLAMEAWSRLPEPRPGEFPARRVALPLFLIAQIVCWFWNPPYPFPFEENLAYADFVSLHQAGAERLPQFPKGTRILTAWPATDEFRRPELGYSAERPVIVPVDDFSEAAFARVQREQFDAIFLYSREFQPRWNLLKEVPLLESIGRTLYRNRPQASAEWIRERYQLLSLGRLYLRGQWVEWLQRPDLPLVPGEPLRERVGVPIQESPRAGTVVFSSPVVLPSPRSVP